MGFGKEYEEVGIAGRAALIGIAFRSVKLLRFTPTGLEIKALNELMELHDAQMEVITVQDMCNAITRAKATIRSGKATRIPTNYLGATP
jgi:response regulator of citrate/malate metabolism